MPIRTPLLSTLPLLAALGLLAGTQSAGSAPEELAELLQRMDSAGKSFTGFTATVEWMTHTAVLNDDSVETGALKMRRVKGSVQGLIEFTQPDHRIIEFKDHKAQIYYPKLKRVEVWDLGKHSEQVDQFLLLGFGESSTNLQKNYELKLLSSNEMILGRKTSRLQLIPKSKDVKEVFNRVDLWIPEGSGYPIQQQLFQKSGNYKIAIYKDLKINPVLPDKAVELKLPSGVKFEYPQR